jgi:hypothetical protein
MLLPAAVCTCPLWDFACSSQLQIKAACAMVCLLPGVETELNLRRLEIADTSLSFEAAMRHDTSILLVATAAYQTHDQLENRRVCLSE